MKQITEYFKIAIRNLRTRRLRSWLTILGVMIGVFLIVSLLSLSEGIKTAILSQLRMMGKDLVMIMPGGDVGNLLTTMLGGAELSDENIKAVKKTKGVEFVVPINWKAEIIRHKGEKKTVLLYRNDWENALDIYINDMGWSLAKGRWPVPGKKELVVGSLVPEEIFPDLKVGDEAIIKGRKFKIVGILNSVGSKQDDLMVGVDSKIFKQITGERKGAKFAFAKIKNGYPVDKVIDEIKENLEKTEKRKAGEDAPSFTVLTSEKVTNVVGNIMAIIQAAIFALASVAIIVGGIGIMNTMYTSVHERIKEIGIMKAVGAKNSIISLIFLIESGTFGMVGGIGGTILGIGLAKIVELYFQFHPYLYLRASMDPGLIIFSLVFSFLVGCLSGYLPARSASKLNPVQALRYE